MILTSLIAAALGGAGGWALARGRSAMREDELRRELQRRRSIPPTKPEPGPGGVPTPLPQDAYRQPDPASVINVPEDAEDFQQMAEAFCVCFRELQREHGAAPSVGDLRDCFLGAIYPDFKWPPVPGDPASAQLMWMIADHEARKINADPSACSEPVPKIVGGAE